MSPAFLNTVKNALRPLAAIADAYDASGLDEMRPEWVKESIDFSDVELFSGRGGKQLLTLQDAIEARRVLQEL